MNYIKSKTSWIVMGIAVLALVGSCASVGGVVEGVGDFVSGSRDDGGASEGGRAASGKGNDLFGRMIMDATGMGAMQDSMVAMSVYANAFFAGGFAYGYDDFEEGEGVAWRIVSRNPDETTEMRIERAFLKEESDGGWWYLGYEVEDGIFVSEAFIGSDYELLIFRYEDPETGEIREWRADEEVDDSDQTTEAAETEATVEESQPTFYEGDYGAYVVGTETVSVPAGSFTAEHVRIADVYDEGGELTYEWWITENVPGRLVKYDWRDGADDTSLTGELLEVRHDYRTRMGSY